MLNLNFLPWRQELLIKKQLTVASYIVLAVIIAVFFIIIQMMILSYKLDEHVERNMYLESELTLIQQQVNELEKYKADLKDSQAQEQLFKEIQHQNNLGILLINELPQLLPDSTYFSAVTYIDGVLYLKGEAPDNKAVSKLLENIQDSHLFTNSKLIRGNQENNQIEFDITATTAMEN